MNKEQLNRTLSTVKRYTDDLFQELSDRIDEMPSESNGGSSSYVEEMTTLAFENDSNIIQLNSDIIDCTCDIVFNIEKNAVNDVNEPMVVSDVPNFTNLIPYNPLSSAPTNPANGIQAYKGSLEFIENNIIKFTCTDANGGGIFKSQLNAIGLPLPANHVIYARSYVSDDGATWSVNNNKIFTVNGDGTYTVQTLFNFTSIAYNATKYVKNPLVLDLTEMYGAGNEPTADQMLNIIPEDVWSNGKYVVGGGSSEEGEEEGGDVEQLVFTVTSKNSEGETIDTYVSASEDKTLDIVANGTIEIDTKPTSIQFTNVKRRVLVTTGGTVVANSKNRIDLHNVDRLLFIGDSYTEGIYYQKGKAWVCQLAEQLDYTCEGYGWGGYTCATLADNITQNLTRYNPIPPRQLNATRAMLMSFVNDMSKGGTDSSVFQANMEKLIKVVKGIGCEPIVCTEFRNVWGTGLQVGLKALTQQYECDFWNILPYTTFLGTTTGSDNDVAKPYYNGSHPAQRTGGIIFNNYLKFAKNLPRPNSALKIYRLRNGINVTKLDDIFFNTRRDKLLKFKEICISHSCLSNPDDWDNVSTPIGTYQNGVISEYGKLMNKENVSFGNWALVECVLPTLKGNIKSLKLNLSDSGVLLYAKTNQGFTPVRGKITDFDRILEYDKITFLLYKNGGFSLNDIYVEWEGNVAEKHNRRTTNPTKIGTELLKNNKVDDVSWLNITGNVAPSDATNYAFLPNGCTKVITIDNSNYIGLQIPFSTIPVGTIKNAKVRVVCRYNPTNSSSEITVDSYDRKELELRIAGQIMSVKPTSYYSIKQEVDMSWTMAEFEIELNVATDITILSADSTPLEVCYISVIEI